MWATTPEERTVTGTLGDLPARAAAASMGPPATLVVGEVASIPAEVGEAARNVAAITPS
jgi:siroheme synthase